MLRGRTAGYRRYDMINRLMGRGSNQEGEMESYTKEKGMWDK